MNKKYAKKISKLLAKIDKIGNAKFTLVETIEIKPLDGFHQWADGKPCEGAYHLKDMTGNSLWVLLIDWQNNNNYYVILFPESKSGPIAELHQLTIAGSEVTLNWQYSPKKRDGKNSERKAYFVDTFLSEYVHISIPDQSEDIFDFLDELFSLANSRVKADNLAPDRPSARSGFPEGKLREKLHLSRERNNELVQQAKAAAQNKDGCLRCVCCGFDFLQTYGEIGKDFIEAHHIKPISTLHQDGEETKIEDLALVCSNCHRMLHRKRPWLEMSDLSTLITANK